MTQPTRGDVHVNRALTNISVAYMQAADNFISMSAFPAIPVQNRSDSYFVFDSPDMRRDNAKPRAPATPSAGSGFDLSTDTYTTEVYALHQDVADQIRANSDPAVDLDRAASQSVMQQLLIQKEINWMTNYFSTGVWTNQDDGGTDFSQWSDGSSDPEHDIDAGKNTILKTIGLMPNTLIASYDVHQALKRHPLITNRYQYTSSESITPQLIARYFEVDRYLIAKASYVSSEEGAASTTNAFIAGKHALLCYVAPNPGLLVPSAGYTFSWSAFTGGNQGVRMKRFYMDELEATRIEGEFAYDHKQVLDVAGYFFYSAVA